MKTLTAFLFLLFLLGACKENGKQPATGSESDADAARLFIRAALDGNFNEARLHMFQDTMNVNYLDNQERAYQRYDPSLKEGYRTASIRINELRSVNDSVSILVFSNSFKNNPDTLRILRLNGKWLVDLKYLYGHDRDSVTMPVPQKDSLP